jgi:hypothetical protein
MNVVYLNLVRGATGRGLRRCRRLLDRGPVTVTRVSPHILLGTKQITAAPPAAGWSSEHGRAAAPSRPRHFAIKDRFIRRAFCGRTPRRGPRPPASHVPGHHRNVGIERATDFFVRPALPGFTGIRLQQDKCFQNNLCRDLPLANELTQSHALFAGELSRPLADISTGQKLSICGLLQHLISSGTRH